MAEKVEETASSVPDVVSESQSQPVKVVVTVVDKDAPVENSKGDADAHTSKDLEDQDQEMADGSVNGDGAHRQSAEPANSEKSTKSTSDDEKEDTKSVASTTTKKSSRSSLGGSNSRGKKSIRRKSMVEVHLNVEPGELWFARMKGHPPWPAIICDEEMLPVSLLSKRPVSARRMDGTWREDYCDDGKNVKDRRYPIMFLGSNEFAWQPNTELQPLNLKEIQELVKNNQQEKRKKELWEAYKVAAENHDLNYFKLMLEEHQNAVVLEAEQRAAALRAKEEREAAKAAREAKKASGGRKSVGGESDYDMMDVEDEPAPPKTAKSSRKRKADGDGDAEDARPPKTLKTKPSLKLQKTPAGKSSAKSTPRKSTAGSPVASVDQRARYFRNQLQRRFLSSSKDSKAEKPLTDADMPELDLVFSQLEADADNLTNEAIDAHRLRTVLKAISKLEHIPLDEKYRFRQRAIAVREKWMERAAGESAGGHSALNTPSTAVPRAGKEHSNGLAKLKAQSEAASANPSDSRKGGSDVDMDADGDAVMSGANNNSDPPAGGDDADVSKATAKAESPDSAKGDKMDEDEEEEAGGDDGEHGAETKKVAVEVDVEVKVKKPETETAVEVKEVHDGDKHKASKETSQKNGRGKTQSGDDESKAKDEDLEKEPEDEDDEAEAKEE